MYRITFRQLRAAQDPEVQQLLQTNASLSAEIAQKNKIQKHSNEEVEGIKLENKERVAMLQNLKCSLESAEQEIARLKSRIVHNPEQLKDVSEQ